MSPGITLLFQEYTEELERLKKDLYAAREKNGIFLSAENFAGMESKLRSQKELIKDLEEKISANVVEMRKVCCMERYIVCAKGMLYGKVCILLCFVFVLSTAFHSHKPGLFDSVQYRPHDLALECLH